MKESKCSSAVKTEIKEERKDDQDSNQVSQVAAPADNMPQKVTTSKEEPSLLNEESSHSKEKHTNLKDEVGGMGKLHITSARESKPVMTTSVKVTGGVAARRMSVSMGLDAWRNDGRKVERKLLMRKLAQLKAEFRSERYCLHFSLHLKTFGK